MIDFINNSDVVNISYDEEQESSVILLNKPIELQPNNSFMIDTKLEIVCSEVFEECIISSLIDGDNTPIYLIADKYSSVNPETTVKLYGYYAGDTKLVLPAGTVIACIGKYIKGDYVDNPNFVNQNEKHYINIYQDDKIRVVSLDQQKRYGEVMLEPDGSRFLKVKLDD